MEAPQGIDQEAQQSTQAKIEKITLADLRPVVPEVGGSVFVLQRNAKDKENRKLPPESPDFGTLDPGEAEATQQQAKQFFDQVFAKLSPEERKTVDILVVAADTELKMPGGKTSPHKRALETAAEVLAGAQASASENGADPQQLLNKTGRPIELTSGRLRDLKILDESPEFVEFMEKNHGTGIGFWEAYEDDRERETRIKMQAEGPTEIANRVAGYMGTLANAMRLYHQAHPGRRAIVWADAHYDNISPFAKLYVTGQTIKDYLPIDNRAGVVFETKADGQISTQLQGQNYPVNFAK